MLLSTTGELYIILRKTIVHCHGIYIYLLDNNDSQSKNNEITCHNILLLSPKSNKFYNNNNIT